MESRSEKLVWRQRFDDGRNPFQLLLVQCDESCTEAQRDGRIDCVAASQGVIGGDARCLLREFLVELDPEQAGRSAKLRCEPPRQARIIRTSAYGGGRFRKEQSWLDHRCAILAKAVEQRTTRWMTLLDRVEGVDENARVEGEDVGQLNRLPPHLPQELGGRGC